MKWVCSRCGSESDYPTLCNHCGGLVETVRDEAAVSSEGNDKTGSGFWAAFIILTGMGLLMQVSALFL